MYTYEYSRASDTGMNSTDALEAAYAQVINYVTDTVTTPANKGKAPGRMRPTFKSSHASLPHARAHVTV